MGLLYVVPTPIGNLEDITLRAIRVLSEVDLILAEDTRTSAKLLKHLQISTPVRAYHMHNEHTIVAQLVDVLQKNEGRYALISDAGTPGISDPGYLLIRQCIEHGIRVETLPGATAFIPAIVNSGFPSHEFTFVGFLPTKKGRQKRLKQLAEENKMIILYESPHRILRTLFDLRDVLGENGPVSVSRELTKIYEETLRGNFKTLIEHFERVPPKGEFVIVIHGSGKSK